MGDEMLYAVFFNQKPVRALASLVKKDRVWYPSMLCKEIDCTYPHMINILNIFEDVGLVTSEGQGRIRILKLTEEGEDLAHDFDNLLRRLDRIGKRGLKKAEESE